MKNLIFLTIFNLIVNFNDPLAQFEITTVITDLHFFFRDISHSLLNIKTQCYISPSKHVITKFLVLNTEIIFLLFIFVMLFLFYSNNQESIAHNSNFFQFLQNELFNIAKTVVKNNINLKQNY
jgi:hypothetical protein